MLKRTVTDYTTNEKSVVTEFVGSSVYAQNETEQVMSDVWETHLVLTSIDAEGNLRENSVAGWYGMRDEDRPEWTIDANTEAFERYRKKQHDSYYERLVQLAQYNAQDPAIKGRVIKVVCGRTSKGAVGKVVVVLDRPYRMGYRSVMSKKLGIATSPRKTVVQGKYGKTFENYADMIWVWAQNCEVETPQPVDLVRCEHEASEYAEHEVASLLKRGMELQGAKYPT